jgi:acetyl esterase
MLRSDVFEPGAVPAETAAVHKQILELAGSVAIPDNAQDMRDDERETRARMSPDGVLYESASARTITIDGPGGPLALRILDQDSPRGVLLYAHGGGFVIGGAAYQDRQLEQIRDATEFAVVSVEYRLAPEYPFPAALDDVASAARWLVAEGQNSFGTSTFALGGDSAGANLAVGAALRLRRDDETHPIAALNLLYGLFDLGGTPSANDAAIQSLLGTDLLQWFIDQYIADPNARHDPEASPLHAELHGLPPTIISVGSRDRLLDDSMFLYCRLLAAGVQCEIQVLPGCDHSFAALPLPVVAGANAAIANYLVASATPAARDSSALGV